MLISPVNINPSFLVSRPSTRRARGARARTKSKSYRPERLTIISVPALQKERHTSASCSCTVIPPALSVWSFSPSAAFADGRQKIYILPHSCYFLKPTSISIPTNTNTTSNNTTNYEMWSSVHLQKRYEYDPKHNQTDHSVTMALVPTKTCIFID